MLVCAVALRTMSKPGAEPGPLAVGRSLIRHRE